MNENKETIIVDKKDLNFWFEKLESLQKCIREPEKCTHDTNEEGEIQPFDYASIDMCLSQITGEIKQYIK